MKSLELRELNKIHHKLETGEKILDVRTVDEYTEGHIPGSLNIPLDQLSTHIDELKKFKTLYIHCRLILC